jgi:DNA-binding transcriptional LysR family regulator
VHTGSFTGAAKRLNQPSSNVSRRIAHLERDLGYRLLLRTTRSLSLTQEGQSLLPLAKQLLEAKNQILEWNEDQHRLPQGRLKLTAPSSFARGPLTQWLISYHQKFPDVQIELIHSNDYLDFQEHLLDFAFRQGPLMSSSLIAQRLFGIHYGVFVSPQCLEQQGEPKQPSDLVHQPIVSSGAQGKSLPWRFKKENWLPQATALLFEDTEQCLQAAIGHQGFTYASRYEALPALKSGDLVEVLIKHRASPADFFLVYPDREHRSVKSQSFLDHVKSEIVAFGTPEGLRF